VIGSVGTLPSHIGARVDDADVTGDEACKLSRLLLLLLLLLVLLLLLCCVAAVVVSRSGADLCSAR
jgi:hypothetical protein